MSKTVLLITLVVSLLMAGCSEPSVQQDNDRQQNASKQRPVSEREKTVAVNTGMSKKEEEKLKERLADLEDKVEQQEATGQEPIEPEAGTSEGAVSEAARDYYAAAAAGNYGYTYDALSSYAQSRFTEEEWVVANTALRSDDASYDIYSTELVDDTTATVALTVITANGIGEDRTTLFVYENGTWKHDLTRSEYELFAGATATASATASATVSASASAEPSPNPSPNRNAPNPNAPTPGGGSRDSRRCEQPAYAVPPGDERDGDNDGCAGET